MTCRVVYDFPSPLQLQATREDMRRSCWLARRPLEESSHAHSEHARRLSPFGQAAGTMLDLKRRRAVKNLACRQRSFCWVASC